MNQLFVFFSIHQQVKRIIKCFCGCSELTEDEVKTIVQCNIEGFVRNEKAKQLFRTFIVSKQKNYSYHN